MADQKGNSGVGRFSFLEIHAYLATGIYPQGLDKSGKSALKHCILCVLKFTY